MEPLERGDPSSLVLRAWTEHGHLRIVVTPVRVEGPTSEPIIVTSLDRLFEVVRAWIETEVLGEGGADEPDGTSEDQS